MVYSGNHSINTAIRMKNMPKGGPYDISHIVAGGNEIYVRARMLTDTNWPSVGPIYAQF